MITVVSYYRSDGKRPLVQFYTLDQDLDIGTLLRGVFSMIKGAHKEAEGDTFDIYYNAAHVGHLEF